MKKIFFLLALSFAICNLSMAHSVTLNKIQATYKDASKTNRPKLKYEKHRHKHKHFRHTKKHMK